MKILTESFPSISSPIAIDGPAASGKSTVARRVAQRLGGFYISTGDMYRALTWLACERGIDPVDEPQRLVDLLATIDFECLPGDDGLPRIRIDGVEVAQDALRSARVASRVSEVAALPEVRQWLIDCQRSTVRLGLVVLEGRDIGTVIFPETPHKFFLTASPEERARRRLRQGGDVAEGATIEEVAAQIATRDRIDSTRAVAPLRAAADAIYIDSSDIPIDGVVDLIVQAVLEKAG